MGMLSGKVAIVTGAGSGIGEQTALTLASHGAKVVVAAHKPASAERVAAAIKSSGGEAVGVAGDVADETVVVRTVQSAIDNYGRIDVLHNNAAVTSPELMSRDTDILNLDRSVWERTLAVNLIGPALFCKHAIPHMIRQGGGSIIMTSSARGLEGDVCYPAYGASKAALINLALNVATMHGKRGIRANTIVVGFVLTDTVKATVSDAARDMLSSHQLTPFFAEPKHIADAVAFLASDASVFITGATLKVDGGITSHTAIYADMVKMGSSFGAA